jgi:hypothetical protein
VLILLVYFYLVESPYFLIDNRRDIDGAIQAMRKIATVNGKG